MKMKLAEIAAKQGGVVFRSQALEAGMCDDEIRQLIQTKTWVAVRRGAYAESTLWKQLDSAAKHRVLIRAAVHRMTGKVVVSHTSGLVLHDLPTWNHDLSRVHVTRDRQGKDEAGVKYHSGDLAREDIDTVDDIEVTGPTRTIIDTAMRGSYEACVACPAPALHRGLTTSADLLAMLDTMRDWQTLEDMVEKGDMPWDRKVTAEKNRRKVVMAS
jgi:predicted transcriptional regulator of viral defense system